MTTQIERIPKNVQNMLLYLQNASCCAWTRTCSTHSRVCCLVWNRGQRPVLPSLHDAPPFWPQWNCATMAPPLPGGPRTTCVSDSSDIIPTFRMTIGYHLFAWQLPYKCSRFAVVPATPHNLPLRCSFWLPTLSNLSDGFLQLSLGTDQDCFLSANDIYSLST